VDLEISDGTIVSATITHDSVRVLDLKEGSRACALFKASDVILGI
jgi:molybdate transport system regulatory protein